MQKRALTINFQRSVTAGTPSVMEVAVSPLSEPNAPANDATLVGGTQVQSILLSNENNPVVFDLVPTDHPDLTERVTYRVAWREKYMGRQFTKDFVMPDFDVAFDDLESLGNIIGGTTYVQWTDVSRPGGVAGLNNAGQVTDADGNVVGADNDGASQGALDAEIVARLQGDNLVRTTLLAQLNTQISQVYTSTAAQLSQAVAQLQNADTTEHAQRQTAINTVNATIASLQTATNAQVASLNDLIDQYNDQLSDKADLVGGKVPSSQLPNVALGHAVPATDQAAMLALTSDQVQPGDFAVRPDGVWFLNATPASNIGNWVQFTVAASVFSINGHQGAVVLSASDVGARSASAPVPLADITGLQSVLDNKAGLSVTNTLAGRVTNIENDTTYVKRVSGLIVRADMPADVVFVNGSNLITKKDGTVLNVGGGGELDIADVGGLQAALDAKLAANDNSVTNPRTPIAHKVSHSIGGSDPLTPANIGAATATHTHAQSDITGLSTSLTNHENRIESLETRVDDLETSGGGGGGGSGASGKTVWWSEAGIVNPLNTSSDDILLRSPFGYDGANYYYDPAGVTAGQAVWPYLTPNGHLKFVKRNESAPTDEPVATATALAALAAIVDTKAAAADLTTLSASVDQKASLAALSALQAAVDLKASLTQLNSTNDAVALRATQSAFDALVTTVNAKADASTVSALTTTVNGKALASDLTALTTRVATVETGKADLVGGLVPNNQLRDDIPATKITGLSAQLTNKADLVTGRVPLSQTPQNIPTSYVVNLDASLAAKADLDGTGKVPSSQIPAIALNTVAVVANRAAMLALTTTQVQAGDLAVITTTADQGSYILTTSDPSQFANWVKLVAPADSVSSVNGQTGTIVLGASDVGARSSATPIPQSDITGLTTALTSKADQTTVTAALATKTTSGDVQTLITDATLFKQKADLAASTAVASTSGQQSVDGTLAPLGAVVLLTAQSSSVNNGLWIVNSGSWTRVADMAAGSYFVKGTAVVVTGGSINANTVWQQTNNSGLTGTNANNWTKILTAGAPPVYTSSLGVKKIGNDFQAAVVAGGGLVAVSGGLQRDPNVLPGKFAADVPGGSTIATITHGLNSLDVQVQVRDKTSGTSVLMAYTVTGVNTISLEFASAPTSGQYRVVCVA